MLQPLDGNSINEMGQAEAFDALYHSVLDLHLSLYFLIAGDHLHGCI